MTTDDIVVQPGGTGTGGTVDSKGLKGGSLGLLSSVVVGMASSAPAYSLAAVLGLIVASGAGVKAASIVLLAFVPIYLIAVAYQELNKAGRRPDHGRGVQQERLEPEPTVLPVHWPVESWKRGFNHSVSPQEVSRTVYFHHGNR